MRKLLLFCMLSVLVTNDVLAHIICLLEELACAEIVIKEYLDDPSLSANEVNILCTDYGKFGKCLDHNNLRGLCPDSAVATALEAVLGYICGKGRQGYIDNLGCLHGSMGKLNALDCREGFATSLKSTIVIATLRDRGMNASSDMQTAEIYVCTSLSLQECFATIVDGRCGTYAGDWVRGLFKHLMEGMETLWPKDIHVNCKKPIEQNMPVLPPPMPMTPGDCGNFTMESILNTCLRAGFVNIPFRPVNVPTYVDFVQTFCGGWQLEQCWRPVREACPAVVKTVYNQVIETTLSTCSVANTTFTTKCDLIGIVVKYISGSMCDTHIDDYTVKFAISMLISPSTKNAIWKFIHGFASNGGGKFLSCLKAAIDNALPEIRTCGRDVEKSVKEFNSQINLLAKYMSN